MSANPANCHRMSSQHLHHSTAEQSSRQKSASWISGAPAFEPDLCPVRVHNGCRYTSLSTQQHKSVDP